MPSINKNSRSLDAAEATKLLTIDQAAKVDAQQHALNAWPGTYNLKLLAEAVKGRKQFVEFEPDGDRFTIRYNDDRGDVFIKPTDKKFVPCGYFSYDRLKGALV